MKDERTCPSRKPNDIAHSFHHVWQCLSKAWVAGRAMGKSTLTLQDEAEEWLSDIGGRQPRVVSQAFIDARVGARVWNSKSEVCRFGIANVIVNASNRRAEQSNELRTWYAVIVPEWAALYRIRSLPDANHAVVEWTETEGILPRLWSLYEKGPRTIDDRNTLRAFVVAITSASDQQAEAWIRAEENLQGHSSETNENPK